MRALRARRRAAERKRPDTAPATAPRAVSAEVAAALLEHLPAPVIACDIAGAIVLMNRAAREIEPAAARLLLADALAGKEVRDREIESGGERDRRVLSVTGGSVRTSSGEIEGAVVVMHDVTTHSGLDEQIRLQSAIAANIAAGVALVRAADGEIVYANEALRQMVGRDEGELVGEHISTISAPVGQAPEARAREIAGALDRHGVWRGEIENVRKDGTRFWAAANISLFEHPEHGTAWIVVETDISERKAAEERLRIVEERFRNVFEEAPVGIAIVGNDLCVIDSNHVLSSITGYPPDELAGKTLADLTHPDDIGLDSELAAQMFSGDIARYRINKRFMTKESDVVAIALTAACVRDAAGRPLHTIAIVEPLITPEARVAGP